MKRFLFIFLLFSVLNTLNAQSLKQINIPAKPSSGTQLKLSEIASNVEYLPLEFNENALLSNIGYCELITKEFLFIRDGGTLYMFSRNGKFLQQIITQGRGPGEGFVRCFTFDEKNRLVYVYNHFANNILVFNTDGKFLKSFQDPFSKIIGSYVEHFRWDSKTGNIFVTFDGSDGKMLYKYAVIDANGKILHREPNYDKFILNKKMLESAMLISPFFSHEGLLFYRYIYNDTIFQINTGYTCSPIYTVEVPAAVTLEEMVKTGSGTVPYSSIGTRNSIVGIIESKSFLLIHHTSNIFTHGQMKSHRTLFDKQKNQVISYFEPEILNDWDGGMNIKIFYSDGIYLWALFHPFDLKEDLSPAHFAKSKALYPEQQKKLRTMLDKLGDEDNPVLMLVTLK